MSHSDILQRWPVCPPPQPYECLSSWVRRLAAPYDLEWERLLNIEFSVDVRYLKDLDMNPPGKLIHGLSNKTGVPVEAVRALTMDSYIPELLVH